MCADILNIDETPIHYNYFGMKFVGWTRSEFSLSIPKYVFVSSIIMASHHKRDNAR